MIRLCSHGNRIFITPGTITVILTPVADICSSQAAAAAVPVALVAVSPALLPPFSSSPHPLVCKNKRKWNNLFHQLYQYHQYQDPSCLKWIINTVMSEVYISTNYSSSLLFLSSKTILLFALLKCFLHRLHCMTGSIFYKIMNSPGCEHLLHFYQIKESGADSCKIKESGADSCKIKESGADSCKIKESGADSCKIKESGADSCKIKESGADSCDYIQ